MKKIIFLLLISSFAFSQKIDTTYYDINWKAVKTKDSASFYGTKQKINDSTVRIRDHYMTDTLQNKGQYINGVKKGRWTYYNPDGSISSDFEFTLNGKSKHWYVFNEESLKPNEKGVYHTVNNWPKFMGSEKTPNDYINKNFSLPDKAIRKGFTSFEVTFKITINEKGKVIDAYEMRTVAYHDKNGNYQSKKIDSKLKYGVEEELIKFLLNMPDWEPAIVRKQPVKSAHNIHIKYNQ